MNRWRTLSTLVFLSLLLIACQPATPAETPASETQATGPEAGGTPSLPLEGQPPLSKDISLDPANAEDEDSWLVNSYLYEGLVRLDGDTVVPALALSWTVSDDGLDYIFSLRPGVVFHDGTPFNADAVLTNFNRWFDLSDPLRGTGAYSGWKSVFLGFKGELQEDGSPVSPFDGIEKVDELTVLIHLNRPVPYFLVSLAQPYFAMVSPTVLANAGDSYGMRGGQIAGTGPYSVGEWSDNRLILQPNASYWGEVPITGLEFPLE
jgi:peptide/nickel transport system substrate-binding protein